MNEVHMTPHQRRIAEFMRLAKQDMPDKPTLPSAEVRVLRAKLILEECLETITALGVKVFVRDEKGEDDFVDLADEDTKVVFSPLLSDGLTPEAVIYYLQDIADGCADISVVTMGTLLACGIPDKPILEAVDQNNLDKFGPGHYIREDGKLVKPPDHKAPDLRAIIENL